MNLPSLRNTETRFGWVSIFLHWFMALVLIGLVIAGWIMTRLPVSLTKLKLYGWHKEWGLLILLLLMGRIVWRIGNIQPSLAMLPGWERWAARTVHWAFYFFMVALPVSGWLLTSAAGLPASFFGLEVLPNLVSASESARLFYTDIHRWLGYGLVITFFAHVAAALKHHFINKNDILKRMLP